MRSNKAFITRFKSVIKIMAMLRLHPPDQPFPYQDLAEEIRVCARTAYRLVGLAEECKEMLDADNVEITVVSKVSSGEYVVPGILPASRSVSRRP